MMCKSNWIGIGFQWFLELMELELNWRLKLLDGIGIGIELEPKITVRNWNRNWIEPQWNWNCNRSIPPLKDIVCTPVHHLSSLKRWNWNCKFHGIELELNWADILKGGIWIGMELSQYFVGWNWNRNGIDEPWLELELASVGITHHWIRHDKIIYVSNHACFLVYPSVERIVIPGFFKVWLLDCTFSMFWQHLLCAPANRSSHGELFIVWVGTNFLTSQDPHHLQDYYRHEPVLKAEVSKITACSLYGAQL